MREKAVTRLLTEREAALLLAMSPKTLEAWRREGWANRPPCYRVGGVIRYSLEDLRKWLDANRMPRRIA